VTSGSCQVSVWELDVTDNINTTTTSDDAADRRYQAQRQPARDMVFDSAGHGGVGAERLGQRGLQP
jgi:hypothetical protein